MSVDTKSIKSTSSVVEDDYPVNRDFNHEDPGAQIELSASVSGVVPDDSFTVDHAVNAMGFGKFQMKLSLITGLCWMADAMEMMILAIIGPALHCSWHLNEWKEAFLTTAVFLGMFASSTFWGYMSDIYGRRRCLRLAAFFLAYWGVLSGFSPNYVWLVFLRGAVGFGIGCMPQTVTLYAEFLPAEHRGKCVILLDCFWTLGACFEVVLALLVMPTLGWRGLLIFSAIPLAFFFVASLWLPESARYDAASGNIEGALSTLRKIASENGKHMLLGRLIVDDVAQSDRGRFTDLLAPELKWTSILLWFIWTTCTFCYYGIVLMTTEIFDSNEDICSIGADGTKESCTADCRPLSTDDYLFILWTTIAEFPGIFFTIYLIEKVGRKKAMASGFFIFAASVFLLFICTSNRNWLTLIIFMARGMIAGVFQASYVYTSEVYPTSLRAVAVGTCSGMARFGAMVSPLVAQVIFRTSVQLSAAIFGIVSLMSAAASIMLPIETKGRDMK